VHLHNTTNFALIYVAVICAAFGLLVWWVSHRRGWQQSGLTIFLAIGGCYVGLVGVTERVHWLYVPCVALILASYAIDFAVRRRSARSNQTTKDDGTPFDGR